MCKLFLVCHSNVTTHNCHKYFITSVKVEVMTFSLASVWLFSCLLAGLYVITAEPIFSKFSEKVALGPRKKPLDFGGNQNHVMLAHRAQSWQWVMTHVTHQIQMTLDSWLTTTHQSLSSVTFAYPRDREGRMYAISISYCAYASPLGAQLIYFTSVNTISILLSCFGCYS